MELSLENWRWAKTFRDEKQVCRIALNFRGSKFSQMAVCEDFVEIISVSKPCACCTCNALWAWHTSKFYLIRTVTPSSVLELAAVSKAMATSKVSLWGEECLLRIW